VKIIRTSSGLSHTLKRPVVTIGNFDGVHRGHQDLIARTIKRARELDGTCTVITFDPHPAKVLRPHNAPPLLTTLSQKLDLFRLYGVDAVICMEFTEDFARIGPDEFIRDILCGGIGVKAVVVGKNYKFGKGQSGDTAYLVEMGKTMGFEVDVVEPLMMEGERISSSRVRGHLQRGEVDMATRLLGRFYSIEGVVIHGHKRGEAIGYPTANIRMINEVMPREGIYAVKSRYGDRIIDGVCYIGSQPTFEGTQVGVEVHLFDFQGDIYGEHLRVYFIERIRGDEKFSNVEELRAMIQKDIEKAHTILKTTPWKSLLIDV